MAFLGTFIAALLIFSEYNTATSFDTFRVLFMRGSKSPIIQDAKAATDEEKSLTSTQPAGDQDSQEIKKALAEQPPMNNVFSWQNIRYTVHVSGGDRLLLDNVFGYVAPGKLTALMGESGAGKVNYDGISKSLPSGLRMSFQTTLLNVLAQRVDTGVVTGDRFVNGHELPTDFQSQTFVILLCLFVLDADCISLSLVVVTVNSRIHMCPPTLFVKLCYSLPRCANQSRFLPLKKRHSACVPLTLKVDCSCLVLASKHA
jgi:hypothetical protein